MLAYFSFACCCCCDFYHYNLTWRSRWRATQYDVKHPDLRHILPLLDCHNANSNFRINIRIPTREEPPIPDRIDPYLNPNSCFSSNETSLFKRAIETKIRFRLLKHLLGGSYHKFGLFDAILDLLSNENKFF
jgi:hypothetical protein